MVDALDLVIVGGGPAGLTAGIYARRAGLEIVLLERLAPGGRIALSEAIENYPGFPEISGVELTNLMEEHAKKFGVRIVNGNVVKIIDKGKEKIINTTDENYAARSVIIASGTEPKRLGVKGEEKLVGRGVSFCATCDGRFFQDKDVCVVGGGDAAIKEALFLSKIVRRIYIVHRRAQLRAEKISQDRILSSPKVELIWNSVVEEIIGDDKVKGVLIRNIGNESSKRKLDVDGVFIFVGNSPNTDMIDAKKDENGFIITNENLETSVQGIFAAGDCRAKTLRQVSTAVGDGALAAFMAEKYIEKLKQA